MCTFLNNVFVLVFIFAKTCAHFDDICGLNNGKKFFLEHGESGTLIADYRYNVAHTHNRNLSSYNKCTMEFITCPSCVVDIQFRYLNISRNCGKASVFDTCGCDYVWIYEPPIEDATGEQFCGRFIKNNISELSYVSQTRTVALSFIYNNEYGHAFTLDYVSKRNRINVSGYPKLGNMNNSSQHISSPFFPYQYPMDLSVEYVIKCESVDFCRISLLFTDFLIADSSIIEFFDWNGQRMYVISGNIFRPPVIISNGPSLVIRFYANGASDFGFKATYSFILGNLDEAAFKPNLACGGHVNNLGGGITMMNMIQEGTKLYDCVWIIKSPDVILHRKTHLYVKIVAFQDFAGTTELTVKQGITSTQPSVEILRHPTAHYSLTKQEEHVVPVSQGFYIRLRGVFTPDSRLTIVYAAFNYKDCFGGSDFLCNNLRCIPILLNCDGFDHCGDNSDELSNCSEDPKDHREYSKIPNFLFPKMEPYSDITTATFIFLTCSFGLTGVILAMALLLYRVNTRARHQRQIQSHIETIHAILEEGARDIEEEIITPDDPPDYEPPPEYDEILKMKYANDFCAMKPNNQRCSQCNLFQIKEVASEAGVASASNLSAEATSAVVSESFQGNSIKIPASPPPSYENINHFKYSGIKLTSTLENMEIAIPSTSSEACSSTATQVIISRKTRFKSISNFEFKSGFKSWKSGHFLKIIKRRKSSSEENLVRYFSDSELILARITHWNTADNRRFIKSFSTDDLALL